MRKPGRKKISLFNLMLGLFLMAAVLVFFVNNIIAVNGLASENNTLQTELNKIVTKNNGLQTEIERLSNFDNIKTTAIDKLKLGFSKEPPKKIEIKASELNN